MNKNIDDIFKLETLVEENERYAVYSGKQLFCDGLFREVLIKTNMRYDMTNEADQAACMGYLKLLLDLGRSGAINHLYDFGIDHARGPWVAFARPVATLASKVADLPADTELVRQVMGQLLQIFITLQEDVSPLVYNRLDPNNIVLLANGSWVLNGLLIDPSIEPWDTLRNNSAKYSAPEVLDVDKGNASPASDIYSLGMVLYELSLGQKIFTEQFPSVYETSTTQDGHTIGLNEKWLYWQVSPQLSVPPVATLINSFPADLSANIEKMSYKEVDERTTSAQNLFDKIEWSGKNRDIKLAIDEEPELGMLTPLTKVLLAVIIAVVVLGGGVLAVSHMKGRPVIKASHQQFVSNSDSVRVTGIVKDIPKGCRIVVSAKKKLIINRSRANIDSDTNIFSASVQLPELGKYEGFCGIIDSSGNAVSSTFFTIERKPPAAITMNLQTEPAAFDAQITISYFQNPKNGDTKEEDRRTTTDINGEATVSIPYGKIHIEVDHPRFKIFLNDLMPKPSAEQTLKLKLVELSKTEIAKKVRELMADYKKINNPHESKSEYGQAKKALIQKMLYQLTNTGNKKGGALNKFETERKQLIQEASNLRAADNQDPEQLKKLAEVNRKLQALNNQGLADKLVSMGINPDVLNGAPVADEGEDTATGSSGGTLATAATYSQSGNGCSNTRYVYDPVSKRYIPSDSPAAKLNGAGQNLVDGSGRNGSGNDYVLPIKPEEVSSMSLEQLGIYIRRVLPVNTVFLKENYVIDKLYITGTVLDKESLIVLTTRLSPAKSRIVMDVRIDPAYIVNDLYKVLHREGVDGAIVHPFLIGPRHRLFIGLPAHTPDKKKFMIQKITEGYVVDDVLLLIELYPQDGAAENIGSKSLGKDEGKSMPEKNIAIKSAPVEKPESEVKKAVLPVKENTSADISVPHPVSTVKPAKSKSTIETTDKKTKDDTNEPVTPDTDKDVDNE